MTNALRIILGLVFPATCVFAQGYPLDTGYQQTDSRYRWSEEHASSEVTDGERKGWTEYRDSVRFGAYGLSVTQRIDPATGLPPQSRNLWGDYFVGITGHKPAVYMSSNWSPWNFLVAEIRLKGDDQDIPQPTARGRLLFLGLREIGPSRMIADAAWIDAAGGILRARCVGWPRSDLFGLSLRYLPPEGRTADALAFVLTCQPYDYSDRGLWERRRWVASNTRAFAARPEAEALGLPEETRLVLHNRLAQTDSGCVLAFDPGSVAGAQVWQDGNTLKLRVRPSEADRDCLLLLGDWVDEESAVVCERFLQAAKGELAALLADVAGARPPIPAVETRVADREIDGLLAAYPALRDTFGDDIARTRTELSEALDAFAATGDVESAASYAALVQVSRTASARDELYRRVRETWVTERLWGAE